MMERWGKLRLGLVDRIVFAQYDDFTTSSKI